MTDFARLSIAVDSTSVRSATKDLSGLEQMGAGIEKLARKIAAAWAGIKLADKAKEAVLLAARYETLGQVMYAVGANAGYTTGEMERYAKALQATGISAIESRNTLTMMAGAQLELAKSSQLARVAQDAAVIGGLNSSEAFERMIQGIRSGQTEVLRTIGINVQFEQAYAKTALQLKKNVMDLTDHEKTLARQNIVLAEGAKLQGAYEASMQTAGKQLNSMTRYVQDLMVQIGELGLPVFTRSIEAMTGALRDAKKWFDENKMAVSQMQVSMDMAGRSFGSIVKDIYSTVSGAGQISEEFSAGEIAAQGLAMVVATIADAVRLVTGTIQAAFMGLSSLVAGATYGITKLFGMIIGFQPPAWMKRWLEGSANSAEAGMNRAWSAFGVGAESNVQKAYTGKEGWDAEEKRMKAQEELQRKMDVAAAANRKRMDQERQALELKAQAEKKAKEATEARAKAEQAALDAWRAKMAALAMVDDAVSAAEIKQWNSRVKLRQGIEESLNPMAQYEAKLRDIAKAQEAGLSDADANAAKSRAWEELTDAGQKYRQEQEQMRSEGERIREETRTTSEIQMQEVERLNQLYAAGAIGLETYNRRLLQIGRDGVSAFGMVADAIDVSMSQASDAFVKMVTTGKGSFKEMVNSILSDLARMYANKAFQALGSFLMDMAIEHFSGLSNVTTTTKTFYPVETVGPIASTYGGSASMSYAAPTASPSARMVDNVSVVVNVSNMGEASGSVEASREEGRKLGGLIKAAIQREMIEQKRPGGLLYGAA